MPPKKKQNRNISGLRNQAGSINTQSQPTPMTTQASSLRPSTPITDLFPAEDSNHEDGPLLTTHLDSVRYDWSKEDEDNYSSDEDEELPSDEDFEFDDEDGLTAMLGMQSKLSTEKDDDWLPPIEQRKKKQVKKGPFTA